MKIRPQAVRYDEFGGVEAGYRLIDTAQGYRNEEGVGSAIMKSDVAREDLRLDAQRL